MKRMLKQGNTGTRLIFACMLIGAFFTLGLFVPYGTAAADAGPQTKEELEVKWEAADKYIYNGQKQGPSAYVMIADERIELNVIGTGAETGTYTVIAVPKDAESDYDLSDYKLTNNIRTYTIDKNGLELTDWLPWVLLVGVIALFTGVLTIVVRKKLKPEEVQEGIRKGIEKSKLGYEQEIKDGKEKLAGERAERSAEKEKYIQTINADREIYNQKIAETKISAENALKEERKKSQYEIEVLNGKLQAVEKETREQCQKDIDGLKGQLRAADEYIGKLKEASARELDDARRNYESEKSRLNGEYSAALAREKESAKTALDAMQKNYEAEVESLKKIQAAEKAETLVKFKERAAETATVLDKLEKSQFAISKALRLIEDGNRCVRTKETPDRADDRAIVQAYELLQPHKSKIV